MSRLKSAMTSVCRPNYDFSIPAKQKIFARYVRITLPGWKTMCSVLPAPMPGMAVKAKGYGATRPLIPETAGNDAARAQNRRVALVKQ
jgi:hypothetical protein